MGDKKMIPSKMFEVPTEAEMAKILLIALLLTIAAHTLITCIAIGINELDKRVDEQSKRERAAFALKFVIYPALAYTLIAGIMALIIE